MTELDKDATRVLEERIAECESKDIASVVTILNEYAYFDLKTSSLGLAFEKMFANEAGFSTAIEMPVLIGYHHSFKMTNGSTWCRTNQGYLGKKYDIKRTHKNGRIFSVKLDGFNRRRTISNEIRKNIVDHYKKVPCAILDIKTNLECDHKDGLKDNWKLNDKSNQKISDFQSLCKTANDAKRNHCAKCKKTGKRYDAKRLGYKVSYLYGDENTRNCVGCYWYDPKKFNKVISKDYQKTE